MAVHDPSQSLDADAAAMVDAARGTTTMTMSYDDLGDLNDMDQRSDEESTSAELPPPPEVVRAWETVSELLEKGGELVTVISGDDHWSQVMQALPQSDTAEYSFFTIPKFGAAVMIGVE